MRNKKWLAIFLIVCLLFSATGTLAAKKSTSQSGGDIALKQIVRNAPFYEEPDTKSARYGNIAKGMAIPSQDMKNGFWNVQVGPFSGYVESKYLTDPNENVTVVEYAAVKTKTVLVALPNRSPNSPSGYQLSKGQQVYVLASISGFVFVKADGHFGMLHEKDVIKYDEDSPAIKWVEMLKQTDIKDSDSKSAARLARANKGNWVAVLGMIDDEKAIVRHGEIIGVMSLKYTKPVDDSAPAATSSNGEYDAAVKELIDQTNGFRKIVRVSPLKVDKALMNAAQTRVEELTRNFSHYRPNGKLFTTVNKGVKDEIIAGWALNEEQGIEVSLVWSSDYDPIMTNPDYTKTGAAWLSVDNELYLVMLFG